jgi:REP element-mobilizing transposase RayT
MARIPRLLATGESTVYHVMSRTALDGFPMGAVENDYLLGLIKRLSSVYFTEIMGFCLMGNHFHLLVRMHPESGFSDEEIVKRYGLYYGEGRKITSHQIPFLREKWGNLSEFIKEIKQTFSRFYNRRHNRRGFFWGDRFKSLIVENGETLVNCLAYIDLNPVRAGIIERPEAYRWNSLGYHVQTDNKDNFLSLDLGLQEFGVADDTQRLRRYRRFIYATGAMDRGKSKTIDQQVLDKERKKNFKLTRTERFKYKTRYFTDSGIIGSRAFVRKTYQRFKNFFQSSDDRRPNRVQGLNGLYSLKRIRE